MHRRVGFVFEAFNLLPNESVLRNVGFPWRQGGDPDNAVAALEAVGLGNRMDYRPGQLTVRERQCVAIARALANDPSVIFADEPTRALDSSSREEIIGLLQKLNDEGRTIAIATVNSGVARHCRRIVQIGDGKTKDDSLQRTLKIGKKRPSAPGATTATSRKTRPAAAASFPSTSPRRRSIPSRYASAAPTAACSVWRAASDEGQVSGEEMLEGMLEE